MHMVFRVLVALMFAAIAFAIGTFLPLSIYWLINGDPGMPGGAALGLLGLHIGAIAAVVGGSFSFVKFPTWK